MLTKLSLSQKKWFPYKKKSLHRIPKLKNLCSHSHNIIKKESFQADNTEQYSSNFY